MEQKINAYIAQLQETKLSQHEKWKQDLQDLFTQRVQVSRIQQCLEQGRQMRYEIPEYVRVHFELA
jgi:ribosomal protein S5